MGEIGVKIVTSSTQMSRRAWIYVYDLPSFEPPNIWPAAIAAIAVAAAADTLRTRFMSCGRRGGICTRCTGPPAPATYCTCTFFMLHLHRRAE